VTRLLLVRHAASPATRRALFPETTGAAPADHCESLDRGGAADAAALGDVLPAAHHCWSSFAERAVETATRAGLGPELVAELAECDFGRWAGRSLPQVQATDPDGLSAWFADPETAEHGGERLSGVRARAAKILLRAHDAGGTIVAITHGGFIKAALLEALDLEPAVLWRLDVAPASVTELHPMGERWRLVRLNWTARLR
jgi:broad specificity phosphatase PhoE